MKKADKDLLRTIINREYLPEKERAIKEKQHFILSNETSMMPYVKNSQNFLLKKKHRPFLP